MEIFLGQCIDYKTRVLYKYVKKENCDNNRSLLNNKSKQINDNL